MDERRYDVVFRGELLEGEDPAVVRQRLVALFKSTPEAVGRLFSGQSVVLRRAVDEAMATRYRDALRKAGAVAHVRPAAGPDGTGDSSGAGGAGDTADTGSTSDTGRASEPGREAEAGRGGSDDARTMGPAATHTQSAPGGNPAGAVPPPSADLATAVILPAGTPFDQPARRAPPQFAFVGLELAAPGGTLIEYRPPPPPSIDTSRLSIAPVGTDLEGGEA